MRKIKMRPLVIYALAVLSGIILLYTSQGVQKAEDRLAALEAAARKEEEAVGVLKAEWAYLNAPGRLEALARDFLALEPVDPSRIISGVPALPDAAPPAAAALHRDVGLGLESDEARAAAAVPPRKPSAPLRPRKEKSFEGLLGELQEGGGP